MVALAKKGSWNIPRETVIETCRRLESVNPHALSVELDVNYGTAERYIEQLEEDDLLVKRGKVWIFEEK